MPRLGNMVVWSSLVAGLVGGMSSAVAQPGASLQPEVEPVPDGALPAPDAPPDAAPDDAALDAPPYAPVPPPGSTQATFTSTGPERWEVLLDRQPACATPCSIYVEPNRFVTLRSFERSPVLLDVGYLPPGSVVVRGKPYEGGKHAAGITFTALSGAALVTGITLTSVGCATDRDGMCTAGLITGGVGAVGLYLSIQLMRSAVPAADVLPGQPYVSGNTVGLAGAF